MEKGLENGPVLGIRQHRRHPLPTRDSIGTYLDHYAAYSVAYGQKLTEKLSMGLTGKVINAQLADISANAYAGDIGAMYQATDRLKLALTADNFGSKLTFIDQADKLPQGVHFAAAYQSKNHWNLTGEGVYNATGLVSGRTGVEWVPTEMIHLRAGYRTDTTKELNAMAGLSAGLGLDVWGQEFLIRLAAVRRSGQRAILFLINTLRRRSPSQT